MNIKPLSTAIKYKSVSLLMLALFIAEPIAAKTVKITMTAKENTVVIDNKGTEYPAWTYDGTIPGPVVRVTEGDTVDFTLINPDTNKESHSMDFHAAVVDVLKEFSEVKPGETKHFSFVAKHPGVFMYHCGAATMAQHIARGMYGLIIVDPKEGFSEAMSLAKKILESYENEKTNLSSLHRKALETL